MDIIYIKASQTASAEECADKAKRLETHGRARRGVEDGVPESLSWNDPPEDMI